MRDSRESPLGWREATLGSCGLVLRGQGGTRSDDDRDGVPCIRYGDIYTCHDVLLREFSSFISRSATSRYTRVQPGDAVFAGSGETFEDIGKATTYCGSDEAYAGGDTIIFRPDRQQVEPRFSAYAVNGASATSHKSRMGQGSSVIHIGADQVRQLRLQLPPLTAQARIADVLVTVDEAIHQTEALIAKTQQTKTGLMQDLFTRGVLPDGQLRPLRDDAPALYRQSELGWIPKDWSVRHLHELADVDRGKFTIRPRNDPRYYGGDFPFIQTGEVAAAGGRVLRTFTQTLNSKGFGVSRQFPAGTILVTIAAHIGDTCILGVPMCVPDSLVGVVPKQGEIGRYLELCIRQRKRWLQNRAPQTAQRNINLADLRPLRVLYPEKVEQAEIAARYEGIELLLCDEERTVSKLQVIRRGLMHDLLTGAVRVPVDHDEMVSAGV